MCTQVLDKIKIITNKMKKKISTEGMHINSEASETENGGSNSAKELKIWCVFFYFYFLFGFI